MKEKLFKIIMAVTIVPGAAAAAAIVAFALNDHPQPVVPVVPPTSVELDPHIDSLDLDMGMSYDLHAKVLPAEASQTVGWESRDRNIVTVNQYGHVETQGVGDTTIIVYPWGYGDSDMKAYLPVHVNPVVVEPYNIHLDRTSLTMVLGSADHQLHATVEDRYGNIIPGYEVEWESSNDNVITVDSNGWVKAEGLGNATVSAWPKDFKTRCTATCPIEVVEERQDPTGLTITPTDSTKTLMAGESYSITANVEPEGIDWGVNWQVTSNPDSCIQYTINQNRIDILAKNVGTASINVYPVEFPQFSKSCEITITPATPTGITISSSSLSLGTNKTETLTATVQPAGAPQDVEWRSTDTDIVEVDEEGEVTAKNPGEATIQVWPKNYPQFVAECSVKVVNEDYLWDIITNPTTGEKEARITGYEGTAGDMVIPENVKDAEGNVYPVTTIIEEAFKNRRDITSCVLPSTLKEIQKSAFEGSKVKSVTIEAEVLGQSIFAQCDYLTSVTFSKNVRVIGPNCFQNTRITELDLSKNNIESIGSDAFRSCSVLTKVVLPASLTSLTGGVFWDCSALTSISVDSNNKVYTSLGSNCIVRIADNKLLFGCKSTLIPASVTKIEKGAFFGSGIESITIPSKITEISESAFEECHNLGTVQWHNAITTINDYAFKQCWDLSSISIPNSVTHIGSEAFYGAGLTSITIPGSVKDIKYKCFDMCAVLENLVISPGVETIESYAFSQCTLLKTISLPSSVTQVQFGSGGSFYDCYAVENINVNASNPNYSSAGNCLLSKDGLTLLLGCKNSIIPNNVLNINSYAFYNCDDLKTISLPQNLETIGEYAFRNCDGLQTFVIPKKIKEISDGVFRQCSHLSSVVLDPNNEITRIGQYAFYEVRMISSLSPLNKLQVIDNCAFQNADGLNSWDLPPSLTTLGNSAFYFSHLASVVIPKSVMFVGYSCFEGTNLTSIDMTAWENVPDKDSWVGEDIFSRIPGGGVLYLSNKITQTRAQEIFDFLITKGLPSDWTFIQR